RHAGLLPGAARWADGRTAPLPARHRFRDAWRDQHSTGRAPHRPGVEPATLPSRPPRPAPAESRTRGAPANAAHPLPPSTPDVPRIGYRRVDVDDLLGSFAAMAAEAGAGVTTTSEDQPTDAFLVDLAERYDVLRVVTTTEPEAIAAATRMAALAPPLTSVPAAGHLASTSVADLGVTSAVALLAATGSLVLDCSIAGDRTASLLPRVHLCVVPADRVLADPGVLWRRFDADPDLLPSNLVVVTGPSRTGDIEQLLTIGVHGPTALVILVTGVPM
ncbi:MAG TPA: LUD domain-containing protein, partial [Acidimicrobiales bacterium]